METLKGSAAAGPIRTAVVGFGISGKVFHAPLIAADADYSLDVIVTADPGRASEAARRSRSSSRSWPRLTCRGPRRWTSQSLPTANAVRSTDFWMKGLVPLA